MVRGDIYGAGTVRDCHNPKDVRVYLQPLCRNSPRAFDVFRMFRKLACVIPRSVRIPRIVSPPLAESTGVHMALPARNMRPVGGYLPLCFLHPQG